MSPSHNGPGTAFHLLFTQYLVQFSKRATIEFTLLVITIDWLLETRGLIMVVKRNQCYTCELFRLSYILYPLFCLSPELIEGKGNSNLPRWQLIRTDGTIDSSVCHETADSNMVLCSSACWIWSVRLQVWILFYLLTVEHERHFACRKECSSTHLQFQFTSDNWISQKLLPPRQPVCWIIYDRGFPLSPDKLWLLNELKSLSSS